MVDFARALSALGIDVVTFNFPLHRTGPAHSGSRAGARGVLSRGDRPVRAQRRQRASSALVHRRQVDGRPNRDAGRGRGSDAAASPDSCCSVIPLHPPGQSDRAPRQASAGDRPADAVRAGDPRRVRHAGRAGADRRRAAAAADAARRRAGAIIRSSCRERIRPRRPRCTPSIQRAIVELVRTYVQLHDVAAAREAVAQIERDASRRRPQHDAIDAVRRAPLERGLEQLASRCRRAPTASRRGSTDTRGCSRSSIGFGIFVQRTAATPDRRCGGRRPRPTHATLSPSPARGASTRRSARRTPRAPPSGGSPAGAEFPPQLGQRSRVGGRRASNLGHAAARRERPTRRGSTSSDHSWPPSNASGADRDAGLAQAPRCRCRTSSVGVPLVARAAADERRRHASERGGVDLRRHVAADRDDAVDRRAARRPPHETPSRRPARTRQARRAARRAIRASTSSITPST